MPKKILGIIFLVIAVLLTLTTLAQFNSVMTVLAGFIGAWFGDKDSHLDGYLFGQLFYWIVHITLMVICWRFGLKWVRRKPTLK